MREISVNDIKKEVAKLCVDANLQLSPEMEQCIAAAKEKERGEDIRFSHLSSTCLLPPSLEQHLLTSSSLYLLAHLSCPVTTF
jgi:hypothetical protein